MRLNVSGTRRYRCDGARLERHWGCEEIAVVRHTLAGTTHLISSDSLAVLRTLQPGATLGLREIAHAAGLEGELDDQVLEGVQGIIDRLIQAGLVLECLDGASGSQPPP